jgi:hypothetical protein
MTRLDITPTTDAPWPRKESCLSTQNNRSPGRHHRGFAMHQAYTQTRIGDGTFGRWILCHWRDGALGQ